MKLGEAVYAQQQNAQGQPGAGTPPPAADQNAKGNNDDIIDAEVVE
jgi:hypothetical protein